MDIEYHDVTSELDAREILRYLNSLGINNISGEVLKYFITDLKKLIKYDLQQKENLSNGSSKPEVTGPERLHSASTFSSRIRSRCRENTPVTCSRDCQKAKTYTVRTVHSAPVLGQRKNDNENVNGLRRACSCIRVKKKPETVLRERAPTSSNNNLIKVPIQQPKKKSDPVSLYHYYTSLWAKYKHNVPGENNWADLRWSVRQKMAGCVPLPKAPINKVPSSEDRDGQIKK